MPCKKSRLDARRAAISGETASTTQIREMMPLQGSLSIERMCELARVSRASFYRSLKEQRPAEEETEVRSAIQQIALEHRRRYGYRRICAELRRRGMQVNHKRVLRMMRKDNLLALRRRRFVVTTNSNHKFEVYLNLARRMKLSGTDQLWIADITYIRLKAEFVYLAVILDAFSRKVVGWALDRTLANRLTITALEHAIAQRRPRPGLVHHSDRGLQYARGEYVAILEQYGDGAQHEPSGESLRQRELREFHEDAKARRDLRKPIRQPGALTHKHRRVHRAVLQPAALALGAGLPIS